MKRVIEKVPVPLAGVTLGLTALGNLLAGLSPVLRWGCGTAAALLFFLLLAKLILFPEKIKNDFSNPIIASVSATFFMTLMQLSPIPASFSPQRPFSSGTRLSPATVR